MGKVPEIMVRSINKRIPVLTEDLHNIVVENLDSMEALELTKGMRTLELFMEKLKKAEGIL